MNTSRFFLGSLSLLILLNWLGGQLLSSQLLLLVWGLILSAHDLKTQSYPFWLWLLGTAVMLCYFPLTSTSLILFLLALLAELRPIGIGSGDFFYLSTLALSLSVMELLWVIQLGSLLGIILLYLQQKTRQTLAFIPCLFVAYLLIITVAPLL